jgi:hypothetical protein
MRPHESRPQSYRPRGRYAPGASHTGFLIRLAGQAQHWFGCTLHEFRARSVRGLLIRSLGAEGRIDRTRLASKSLSAFCSGV